MENEDSRSKWKVRSLFELEQRAAELSTEPLVQDLIPARAIAIVVGDSGLGKSPLLYQMACCVATSTPFLGKTTVFKPVLYLDFENGVGQACRIVRALTEHLQIDPAALIGKLELWNANDASDGTVSTNVFPIIQDLKPGLVVIDSLSACFPDIEEKNSSANEIFRKLRAISAKTGATIIAVHHLRKPSEKSTVGPLQTEEAKVWLRQARGASALINSSDVRIGIDGVNGDISSSGRELAICMAGFARVQGEIPRSFLVRVFDDEGEPRGYEVATGLDMLHNPLHEELFHKLPGEFRFMEARRLYGKGPQATTDFLGKCLSCGLVKRTASGYEKTGGLDGLER